MKCTVYTSDDWYYTPCIYIHLGWISRHAYSISACAIFTRCQKAPRVLHFSAFHYYKCKNQIICRDDTMPKTADTGSHCKVLLRACNNLLQPPPYISFFWGCGRLLHAFNHTLQWLLVSAVFGTVSSLHLTSIKIIKNEVGCRDDTVPKTGDTRTIELRVCNNLPQPQKPRCREGIAEDCCILSTLPCSVFLCHLFLARCHPYILLHF